MKIFTRWVNQKLASAKHEPITDLKGFSDGTKLVKLIGALSEETIPGKELKAVTGKIQQVANLNRVLAWLKDDLKVQRVTCSPEDLIEGSEIQVMGLIWGVMQRFLKFGDDEDEQNLGAEESLKMWASNQVASYGIEIKSFTKSFHNGAAYAALMHKGRPKFIDPADMTGSNDENLQKVLDAATRYFDLEQYINPAEIQKLDAKSAFIFLSEFYYGIAKMRKVDLSCRRISKLVTYTKINDALKAEYTSKSTELVGTLDKVNAVLNDRTIDNTMAGAKGKIEQFSQYKKDDKPSIVAGFLGCESVYNQVAMRLNDHHRPAFAPPAGHDVPALREALKALEALEKERQVELVAELNRQIRLAQLNVQHQARFDKISAWSGVKQAYLSTKETIASSGDALYQINVLNAYNDESKVVQEADVAELNKIGAELVSEKYENSADVQQREATVASTFAKLGEDSATKMKVLEDDLARMKVKENIDLVNLKHIAKAKTIAGWQAEKEAYLNVTEEINSVADAQLQLSILDMFDSDQIDMGASVTNLKAVGQEILTAEYKSDLSEWKFATPDEVTGRESETDSKMAHLSSLSATKRGVLDGRLANEIEKERLRLKFATEAGEFSGWTASLAEDLSKAHFGFSLQEVEAFQAKMDAEDAEIKSSIASKTATFTQTNADATAAGVTENKYTSSTLESLAGMAGTLEAALEARGAAYATELERVRYNDGLCKKFADIATPLASLFDNNKEAITSASDQALEAQLAMVDEKLAEKDAHAAKTGEATTVNAEMTERGVEFNPHSHLNANDLDLLRDQYNAFLEKKQAQVKEEIEYKAMRGLTHAQFEEIEAQFKQFDKNGNGTLSKSEFKSALFSLGEEKTSKEVAETMNKYGSEAGIDYNGFKEFMISQLGDTDTKPEILEGWELINKGASVAKVALMQETILRDEDVAYIQETAPKEGDDYNYTAWTEDVFAR